MNLFSPYLAMYKLVPVL